MMSIQTFDELKKKLAISFATYENMIIQEEVQGDEIRILVVKETVILAYCRTPAIVT
jgi:hypothetical protein